MEPEEVEFNYTKETSTKWFQGFIVISTEGEILVIEVENE